MNDWYKGYIKDNNLVNRGVWKNSKVAVVVNNSQGYSKQITCQAVHPCPNKEFASSVCLIKECRIIEFMSSSVWYYDRKLADC